MIATMLLGLLATTATGEELPTGQPIGWRPSAFFVEQRNVRDAPDFHREFYPRGKSEANWTERAVVTDLTVADGTTPAQVLDGVRDRAKADCADGGEYRYDLKEKSATQAQGLWHCPRNAKASRGEIALWRVLLARPHAYLIVVQGDYAPYAPEKFPLLKVQGDRWIDFQASFVSCDTDWTSWGCAPDPNRYMNSGPAELTPEESVQVAASERRGRELYHLDQLAWHATDFAQEKRLIAREKNGLFIAVADETFPAGSVYFIQNAGHGDWVRVDTDANGALSVGVKDKSLPQDVRRRVQALNTARDKAEIRPCTKAALNAVVMRDDDGNGWLAYFLTPIEHEGQVPLGGHTRVHLDAAGENVLATDYPMHSCMTLDPNLAMQAAGRPTAMFTQVTADVPWETLVFQSLAAARDLVVLTRQAVWRVAKGHITKLLVGPPLHQAPETAK